MRSPHIVCECGDEFLFGVGYEKHAREVHGFIKVYRSSGMHGVHEWHPILSHPAHQKDDE